MAGPGTCILPLYSIVDHLGKRPERRPGLSLSHSRHKRHHYLLASRAIGEQNIAAFLLGDLATSKKDVEEAWMVAKVADPAADIQAGIRYILVGATARDLLLHHVWGHTIIPRYARSGLRLHGGVLDKIS